MLRDVLPKSRDARTLLVGHFFSAVGRGLTLPFLFIYLSKVRHIDATTVFLLASWMGVVSIALAPTVGTLIDRLGARRVVLPLFLVVSTGEVLLAFADSVLLAAGSLTLMAIGYAGIWPSWTTIFAALVTPEERQRMFGLSFTLMNLGIGTGGLIAGAFVVVTRPGTFQAVYFADACTFLVPFVMLLVMRHVGRRVPGPVATPEASGRGGYRAVLHDKSFVQFFVFALVLITVGYAQVEIAFTAFATNVALVTPRIVSWALTANTVVIVVLQIFVLRWLEGRSRARALTAVALIFGASWLVLGVAGWAGGANLGLVAALGVIMCSAVFALGETLMSPVMPAITNALATDELRGRYNAIAGMAWGIGGIVGPIAAGPLIGGGHEYAWLTLVVAGSAVAAVMASRLRHRLTPAQDGRPAEAPATAPEPIHA